MVVDDDDYDPKDAGSMNWWLRQKESDPEWVAERDAKIEAARVCRETKSWLGKNPENWSYEDE